MKEKKIKAIFMIEPTLKQRAEEKAKEEGLSFAALIRKLLTEYVGSDQTVEDQIVEIKKELAELREMRKVRDATQKTMHSSEVAEIFASLWDGVEERLIESIILTPYVKKVLAILAKNQTEESNEQQ